MEKIDNLKQQRLEKLDKIKELGLNPYPMKFVRDGLISELKNNTDKKNLTFAGRIVSMRKMGKAAFFHIKDSSDKIQVYIQRDSVGEENFNLFKCFDMGDFVGVTGYLFITQTGELSVHAEKVEILSKSLIGSFLPVAS